MLLKNFFAITWVASIAITLASCANADPAFSDKVEYKPQEVKAHVPNEESVLFSRYEKERALYVEALDAYGNGDIARVRELRANELKDYPLGIYLDYSLLQLSSASFSEVMNFINQNKHETLANRLKAYYISKYANNGDYQSLLKISPQEPNNLNLKCSWHRAHYQHGDKNKAIAFTRKLYTSGDSLPTSCGLLVNLLSNDKYITDKDDFKRLEAVYWTRYGNRSVNVQLGKLNKSTSYKMAAKLLNSYYGRSSQFNNIPSHMRDTAVLVFKRHARETPLVAYTELNDFQQKYHPTAQQLANLKYTIATYMMYENPTNVPFSFVDKVIHEIPNKTLVENRLRKAIWMKDYHKVLEMYNLLPKELQREDNFVYWHARSLVETGNKVEGKKILEKLAQERSFYGFYTATELDLPLNLNEELVDLNVSRIELANRNPSYARYIEFSYLNDKFGQRTEWFMLMPKASKADARMIAHIESKKGNEDLAIWETIYQKDWSVLTLRFPLSYVDIYNEESKKNNVSKSFMYGITRQESMMNPKAISAVGARGLMQLMPATAKIVSKKNGYTAPTNEDLLTPAINVRLGGAYLRELLNDFDNNRIYVAAGYNAGPGRARRWQSKDGIKRDVITYIESIPFTETRGYVQKVIFYDYVYQHLLKKKKTVFLTTNELKEKY